MKKYSNFSWLLLLVAALALAGCGKKNAQNAPGGTENSGDNSGQSVTESVKQKLSDLITTGAGMKCVIEDPQMGQITMYAKGEKAKMEGFAFMPMSAASGSMESGQPPKEEKGTMINDGAWVYMWSGKEGIKFNVEEMK